MSAEVIKILFLAAIPQDITSLQIDEEMRAIDQALRISEYQDRFDVRSHWAVRYNDLQELLLRHQPHIVHFSGHGSRASEIILESEEGMHPVGAETLSTLFAILKDKLRCVILNACYSNIQALAIAAHIDCVIGMSDAIEDAAAIHFASAFYQALGYGRNVKDAFDLGCNAIALGNLAAEDNPQLLALHANPTQVVFVGPESHTQSSPILFLPARNDQPVAVEKQTAVRELNVPPPPEPDRPPQMSELIGREAALVYYAEQVKTDGVAVIVGMAGVGKTALAAALVRQLSTPEKTFWHSLQEGEGVQPLIWALAGFLAWHGHYDLWRLLNIAPSSALPQEMVVDHLLQRLRHQRYLLCLDNLQFLREDPLLIKLMTRIRQAYERGEVAVVITARFVPDFLPVSALLPLAGLDLGATQRLFVGASVHLSPESLAVLHEKTEGNPQLLRLAINSLRQQPQPERWVERLMAIDDIERYLLRTVDDRLNEEEREILGAVAALLGYSGPQAVIEHLLDRGNLRRSLRALCDRFLLRSSQAENEREYGEHAIIQAFYYDLLNRSQRQLLHRLAGEYYEREEHNVVKAALHYERSAEVEKAVAYLLQAGDQALRVSAYRNALDFYRRALALLATVEKTGASRKHPQRAMLLAKSGEAHLQLGEYHAAQPLCEECLALARTHGDQQSQAHGLRLLGVIADQQGEYTQAAQLSQQALAIVRAIGNRAAEAQVLNNLGLVADHQGEYAQAAELYQQALALHSHIGDQAGKAQVLNNLGLIADHQGEYVQAAELYQQALALHSHIGDRAGEAQALTNLGLIARYQGLYTQATELYQQALALNRSIGNRPGEALVLNNLGITARGQREYARAIDFYQQSLAIAGEIGNRYGQAMILTNLGDVAKEQGEYTQATQLSQQALVLVRAISNRAAEAIVLISTGYIAFQQQEIQEARRCFCAALEIGIVIGHIPFTLASLVGIAHVLTREQHKPQALRLLGLALYSPSIESHAKEHGQLLLKELQAELPTDVIFTNLEVGKQLKLEIVAQATLQTEL